MLIFMFILLKCNVAYVVFPLKIVCIKLDYSLYYSSPHKVTSAWLVKSVVGKPIPFSALSLSQHEGQLVGWLVLSGTFEME